MDNITYYISKLLQNITKLTNSQNLQTSINDEIKNLNNQLNIININQILYFGRNLRILYSNI